MKARGMGAVKQWEEKTYEQVSPQMKMTKASVEYAFEAEMPAGRARMIYWPDGEKGFNWAVEAKTQKGWRRFTEHHYFSSHPQR